MSIAETKARIHELLVAGFGEEGGRGFSFSKLPSKDPNYRRWSVFSKAVAVGPPAPSVLWVVIVDILGSRQGKSECVTLYMDCCMWIEAVGELIGGAAPPLGPGTYSFPTRGLTAEEPAIKLVESGADPAPALAELFAIVDRQVVPRFERYSVLESMVRMLTPAGPLGGGANLLAREADDDESPEYPWSFMSAIAGAYLLGRMDVCEQVIERARARYGRMTKGSVEGLLGEQFETELKAFYEGQGLEGRGCSRERWLGG